MQTEALQDQKSHRSRGQSEARSGKKPIAWKSDKGYTYVDEPEDENDEGDATRMGHRERSQQQKYREQHYKPQMRKNPDFGGVAANKQNQYISSDDEVPIGFGRRKRASSNSSFNQRFESENALNVVGLQRKINKYENTQIELNNEEDRKAEEEERKMIEASEMLGKKREKLQAKLREHQANQMERESQHRQSQYMGMSHGSRMP